MRISICLALVLFSAIIKPTFAQTTPFTYQGKVTEGGGPANGSYDVEFRLFDALSGGTQIGPANTLNSVQVTNGIFTVQLDFGLSAFSGPPRFLGISVRAAGGPTFTVLTPRQPVSSNPYSIRSLNAGIADGLSVACVSCVTSSQIASVSGSSVTGPIPVSSVPAGNGNYVQNSTAQQGSSNFNISGNGTAGGTLSASAVDSATQYNIGGGRVLSAPGNANLFAGYNSGTMNTGSNNSFFGAAAGALNTAGGSNAFFGTQAGANNDNGTSNAFFGYHAGFQNIESENSFFGYQAGESNTIGFSNSFFGSLAGRSNTTGRYNSFYGQRAGNLNTTGEENSFFGESAGFSNTSGSDNAFFGSLAGITNTTGSFNAFFGDRAGDNNSTGSNNSFFGRQAGNLNSTGIQNSFFGEAAGAGNTSGGNNAFFGYQAGAGNTSGLFNLFLGTFAGNTNTTGNNNTIVGYNADLASNNLSFATAIGAGASVATSNTIVLGRSNGSDNVTAPGRISANGNISAFAHLSVGVLGTGGSTNLCQNASNEIATCSSSLRYKTQVSPFLGGLDIVRRLRPISFTWKEDGKRDLGLGAEEVERVEPLLTFRNQQGEIEGIRYNQLSAVLINAVKEQQAQITRQERTIKEQQQQSQLQQKQITKQERFIKEQVQQNQLQQEQLRQQQQQLDTLKILVCSSHPRAPVCKVRRETLK